MTQSFRESLAALAVRCDDLEARLTELERNDADPVLIPTGAAAELSALALGMTRPPLPLPDLEARVAELERSQDTSDPRCIDDRCGARLSDCREHGQCCSKCNHGTGGRRR